MLRFKLFENKSELERNIENVTKVFSKYKIDFMFIGRGAANIQGFHEMTQDIDIYPKDESSNKENIIKALKELHFKISKETENEILKGKDFIQFKEPFEFDIVFHPDGFESYSEAVKYKKMIDNKPCLNITGIIKSKKATGRPKDKISIKTLSDFKQYLLDKGETNV